MEMTIFRQKKKDGTILIPLDELMPNPMQPRLTFCDDEIKALADSIRQYGVIQPLAVRPSEPTLGGGTPTVKARYEIIAGERRWRAAKLAGLDKVPCVMIDADRNGSAAMALVENLQRSDLSYFEEAIAMQNLLLLTGKTQSELAKMLSISQSTLSNKLRLLKLTERERLMAAENGFSERHARALVRIDSERERRPVMLEIIKNRLSAPETERLVDEVLSLRASVKPPDPVPPALKTKKPKRAIKGRINDLRFLYNTVDRAVRLLNTAGLYAVWEKTEGTGSVDIHITVNDTRGAF